jgi:hypothetical protein
MEGKVLRIYIAKNTLQKEDPMVEMGDEEVMSSLEATKTFGRCIPLNSKDILWPAMVEMEAKTEAPALKELM